MDQLAFQIDKGNSAADISSMTCSFFPPIARSTKEEVFLRNPLDFR